MKTGMQRVMKLVKFKNILIVALVIAAIFLFFGQGQTEAIEATFERDVTSANKQGNLSTRLNTGSLAEVFAIGDINAAKEESALIAKRRKKMMSKGYGTPEKYDEMSLLTLKDLAAQGDIYAMLQVGERLNSEDGSLTQANRKSKEGTIDPKIISKQYFTDALNSGHLGVTAVVIEQNLAEGDLVEAYAWQLVSEKLGVNKDNILTKHAFSNLPQEDQVKSRSRAELIWAGLIHRLGTSTSKQ